MICFLRKYLILSLLFLLIPTHKVFSQEAELDSILDKVLFEDEEFLSLLSASGNFQFIYARTNYENRTYFAGRDIGINQYNTTGQLVYFHSIGIHAGIGGVWYDGFEPKLYNTMLSTGYSGKIGRSGDYRYRASFDQYFFGKVDTVDHTFSNSLNAGATIDKNFAGTRIDVSLLTGKETGVQVSWDFYGDFRLLKLGTYDKIRFEPEVSFYFGSEEIVFAKIGRGTGTLPRNRQIYYSYQTKFGLLNTEIMFPVTVDYKNFDLEVGYNINIPKTFQPDTKIPVSSYFNVSLGYIFSLN